MAAELHDLLDRGVPADVPLPDTDGLLRRGARRRQAKRVGAGVLAGVLLLGGTVVIGDLVTGADVPVVGEAPGESGWQRISDAPITPREDPMTAAQGDRVLVWGGQTGEPHVATTDATTTWGSIELQDGAVYDQSADSWTAIPPAPGLSLRGGAHVELTGDTVLVWGGYELQPVGPGGVSPTDGSGELLLDGAIHDLTTGTWGTTVPPAPLTPRTPAVVDWDGTELLVWGGMDADGQPTTDGARWTASAGWTAIADFPLTPRLGSATAWDADQLVVWGGGTNLDPEVGEEELTADGAAYDRATDTWRVLPEGPLSPRWFSFGDRRPSALLTGDRLLVAGGAVTTPLRQFRDGAWLDLSTDTWEPITPAPAEARYVEGDDIGAYAVRELEEGLLWLYDPATDRWDRIEVGRRVPDVLPAAWGRVLHDRIAGFPDEDDVWRPVAIIEPTGAVLRPGLTDIRDSTSRSFHAVVPIESGVVLWGGTTQQTDGEAITEADWTATGWFLPAPAQPPMYDISTLSPPSSSATRWRARSRE